MMRVLVIKDTHGDIRTMLIAKSQFDDVTGVDDFLVKGRESLLKDLGYVNVECDDIDQVIAVESGVFEQTL